MTCIVGFCKNGNVYMGGDSAGVAGLNIRSRADEKVFVKDDMIYGFTSSFRMGQVLRYCFKRPVHEEGISDYEYLCSDYISALIKCFNEHGYLSKENDVVSGGTFLIGYKGNLYRIEEDFQVGINHYPYDSCGCGEEYALGAIKILTDYVELSPTSIVGAALSTAEKFSAGVRSPFVIEVLEGMK